MEDKIRTLLDDTAASLAAGDMESALRLSAEALATADAALKRLSAEVPAKQPDADVKQFLVAADTHVRCLLMASAPVQALSCALLSVCTADICRVTERAECRGALVALLKTMLIAEMSALDTLPINDQTHESGKMLLSMTGFLMNSYGGASDPLLEQISQICDVQSEPLIDGEATPATDLKRILAEMLGIAVNLGILEFE